MTPDLRDALERLSDLLGQLEGPGGNDKVTARKLTADIMVQANTVAQAYRQQRADGEEEAA